LKDERVAGVHIGDGGREQAGALAGAAHLGSPNKRGV